MNSKGYTLIELMVALAITSIVMVLVFGMLFFQTRSYDREGMLSDAQQNVRIATDEMVRNIRMAGGGIPKVPLYTGAITGSVNNAAYPIMIIDGARLSGNLLDQTTTTTNMNDSIIVIYADDNKSLANTTLQASMSAAAPSIIVPTNTANVANGFTVAGITPSGTSTAFIIVDQGAYPSRADLFLVTGFNNLGNGTTQLLVDTVTPQAAMFNNVGAGSGHQSSATSFGIYNVGARVRAVKVVRYDFSPYMTNFPITSLVNGDTKANPIAEYFGNRITGNPPAGTPQATAADPSNDNNQALSIQYSTISAGASTGSFVSVPPANPYTIGTVRITLTARTVRPIDASGGAKVPRVRVLTTDIQPRSFNVF